MHKVMKENDKEPEQNNDINLRNDLNKCKQIKNMVKGKHQHVNENDKENDK
jgi:hypothetical protein